MTKNKISFQDKIYGWSIIAFIIFTGVVLPLMFFLGNKNFYNFSKSSQEVFNITFLVIGTISSLLLLFLTYFRLFFPDLQFQKNSAGKQPISGKFYGTFIAIIIFLFCFMQFYETRESLNNGGKVFSGKCYISYFYDTGIGRYNHRQNHFYLIPDMKVKGQDLINYNSSKWFEIEKGLFDELGGTSYPSLTESIVKPLPCNTNIEMKYIYSEANIRIIQISKK